MTKHVTYKDSGVDINEADRLVDFLRTRNRNIGGFSGLMPVPKGFKKPMLVASTDGVGTKLLVAKAVGKLGTIGIDLVAMVINDLLVCGARPLFFLDYYATGTLRSSEAQQVIEGILQGCEIAGCPLIGGETAELPGLYQKGDFDLAGFGVGVVEAEKVIDGRRVMAGDLVYGFSSSGLHSNGYSLARRVLLEGAGLKPGRRVSALGEGSLADHLLEPTRIYTSLVKRLLASKANIRAFSHITGGGIEGNLNRVLPPRLDAEVDVNAWERPPIFHLIQEKGPVAPAEMFRTFNMGIGFMAVAPSDDQQKIFRAAAQAGEKVQIIGRIVKGGSAKVRLINLPKDA